MTQVCQKEGLAPSGNQAKGRNGDSVRFYPKAYLAAQALGSAIHEPPFSHDPAYYDDEDVRAWQKWWEANKERYR